jgi:hypothetical protein
MLNVKAKGRKTLKKFDSVSKRQYNIHGVAIRVAVGSPPKGGGAYGVFNSRNSVARSSYRLYNNL